MVGRKHFAPPSRVGLLFRTSDPRSLRNPCSTDLEAARALSPNEKGIEDERKTIQAMMDASPRDLQRMIQEQKAARPAISMELIMMDQDGQIAMRESRTMCATHCPPNFDCKADGVPGL